MEITVTLLYRGGQRSFLTKWDQCLNTLCEKKKGWMLLRLEYRLSILHCTVAALKRFTLLMSRVLQGVLTRVAKFEVMETLYTKQLCSSWLWLWRWHVKWNPWNLKCITVYAIQFRQIQKISSRIQESFDKGVGTIFQCPGHLIMKAVYKRN